MIIAELKRTSECVQVTKDLFWQILDSTTESIAKIRRCEETLRKCNDKNSPVYKENAKTKAIAKAQLPGFIFQCENMESWHKIDSKKNDWGVGHWRSQDHSILNGLAMIDVDHVDDPISVYQEKVVPYMKEHKNVIKLVYVTPSGHGLKIVFVADLAHGNLISNQLWLAQEIGITVDDSCKDASRLSFASTRADVLYIADSIFDYYNEEYSAKYTPQYNKGLSQPDLFKPKADIVPKATVTETPKNSAEDDDPKEFTYLGLKPWEIMEKLLEGVDVAQGNRHQTLLSLVSASRYFCDRDEKIIKDNLKHFKWYNDLVAENAVEVERTITDAMGYQMKPYLPKDLKNVLRGLKQPKKEGEDLDKQNGAVFEEFGQKFSAMFKSYPCMRAVCRDMPVSSYPALIFASSAMFGTLMTRCTYHFYDKPQIARRLNYGIMVIADPAMRKSTIEYLNDLIMMPVRLSDDLGNDAINDYKRKKVERATSTKEQKKDALVKPDVMIRIHGTRTANGVFIEDMVNCKENVNGDLMHLHLYTFDSELDSAKLANSGGQWIDKSIFELKAFHNETDNQQYKNVESVNGPFKVFWNYVYTGTPLSLSRKVNERNFGSGLFSRLAVIPLYSDMYEMMPFAKNDTKLANYDKEISEWAKILDKVSGELPIADLVKVTYEWTKEKLALAEIEDNKKDAQLCKRVAWYGINVSVPFIFMRHFKEWEKNRSFGIDDKDKELCELVMDIQYYSQNFYFGKLAEMYFQDKNQRLTENMTSRRTFKVIDAYNSLPSVFTKEDVSAKSGMKAECARIAIYRWVKQGLVEKQGKTKYKKKVSTL